MDVVTYLLGPTAWYGFLFRIGWTVYQETTYPYVMWLVAMAYMFTVGVLFRDMYRDLKS
jgi:hypothetical protein